MPRRPRDANPSIAADASQKRQAARIAGLLLPWYDRHHRSLPWRANPGQPKTDPYRVWLSEIMLQQTTVATVGPYFARFLARWPALTALANAPQEDVLAEWAGLGYYARARNLHACARVLRDQHGGRFPDTVEALLELPGIGAYTAAAIAAIAFDRPAAVMDGNVERVLARLFAVREPLPAAKPILRALAEAATPTERPGDYAQAMMDLGATVCSPSEPDCLLCPLNSLCAARKLGIAASLPAKAPKPERPRRHTLAFLLLRPDGAMLFRRRPEKGLLGGMLEVPSAPWRDTPWQLDEALAHAPLDRIAWQERPTGAEHVFTHFALSIRAAEARVDARQAAKLDGNWLPPDEAAVPTAIKKMLRLRSL